MNIIHTLLEISVYSAVLYAVIMLAKKALRRQMSPALHYAVWALLIVRLLVPITIDSGMSFIVIPSSGESAQNATQYAADGSMESVLSMLADTGSTDTDPQAYSSLPDKTATENAQNATQALETPGKTASLNLSAEDIVCLIWLLGVGISLIYIAASYVAVRRRITRNAFAPTERLTALFGECKTELGIRRKLKITGVCGFASPALFFPDTVLIPAGVLAASDDAKLRFVLRHELTHYQRRDHIVGFLLLLLQAVYWFNPIVWLASRQIRLDMEVACDNRLAGGMNGAEKQEYASTVLSMFSSEKPLSVMLGMAVVHTRATAEKRIRGIFAKKKSTGRGRVIAALLACLLLLTCFTTACQPTPEQSIIVGKNQDAMLSAAVQTPDASGTSTAAFSLFNMDVPETYTFSTVGADGRLTVSADAKVTIPGVDTLPTAEVVPGTFTQEMVSGMLGYLFGDIPYYQFDTRITKDGYERMILDYQRNMAQTDDEEAKAYYQAQIEELQAQMADAPEELDAPKLSDGTMVQGSEAGEYSINVASMDSEGRRIGSFQCYASTGTIETGWFNSSMLRGSTLFYSNYSSEDDDYYNYTMDNAQQVRDDSEIPDDLEEKLGITLAEAKQEVQGLLDAAGISDMTCSAAFVVDDHGTGHVDDYTGVASDFAYKLFYTRTVNGVPVLPTTEFAQNSGDDYDYTWIYENMQVIVTDGGIVDINWYSPCSVSELITDNTNIIDFDAAAEVFEQKILTFYEARIDAYGYQSTDITIDGVQLGLVRIKQQNAEGTAAGLYVPVWAFYGTVKNTDSEGYVGYDSGCDFHDAPYIVLAVNAINGSIIDLQKGY